MNFSTPHRRWNPLKKEWVLVSPQRAKRPWSGSVEDPVVAKRQEYDPGCYLCPGNARSSGKANPSYRSTFVFENDFPALLDAAPDLAQSSYSELGGLIQARSESGICRVVCFSPRHDLTLAQMSSAEIRAVIDAWASQCAEISQQKRIRYILVFENKGSIMGCSNPHPHGQIWATESIPNIPLISCQAQDEYFEANGRLLLTDYLTWELAQKERIVCMNDAWVALVPFWAVWPFEVMILPRTSAQSISQLSPEAKDSWAGIIQRVTGRYDKLFKTSFPYSMGVYQRPTNDAEWPGFLLHQVFLPPLLRSATVKKFMAGFELLAELARDISPESTAEVLRNLPE